MKKSYKNLVRYETMEISFETLDAHWPLEIKKKLSQNYARY